MRPFVLLTCLLANACVYSVQGLANVPVPSSRTIKSNSPGIDNSRRAFVASSVALLLPSVANARYILNDDGEYDEVKDTDWQTAWKGRLEKAQSMSTDEVFMAARGASNTDQKDGPESDASKKRRAMAGCRNTDFLTKSGVSDTKTCTSRVLGGDFNFMLDVM